MDFCYGRSTRWIELFALNRATAQVCAKTLTNEIILRYGTPRRVISDNGVLSVSDIMQQVAHCFGFTQTLTHFYYAAANPEERRNRDLKVQLGIIVEQHHNHWDQALPAIRFALNTLVNITTGYTPSYLCFARELRTPTDAHSDFRAIVQNENFISEITPHLKAVAGILQTARENGELQQDRNKRNADKYRRVVTEFNVGDNVLVDVHAISSNDKNYSNKLAPRRDGPYVIVRKLSPVSYIIADKDNLERPLGKYHVSALTPFIGGNNNERTVEPITPLRKKGRPRKVIDQDS